MQISESRKKILFLTQFSILLAIEALFCFTPLGSLPAIGPVVATLAMIPVVITAILLGVKAGTMMGLFAGLFSFMVWTFMPPPSPVGFIFSPFYTVAGVSGNFWSLVICFVPRIFTGTAAALVFNVMNRKNAKSRTIPYYAAGAVGSMVNTLGVMGLVMVFFGQEYASAMGGYLIPLVLYVVLTNGIPEAIVAAIAARFVCRPIKRYLVGGADA